MTTQAVTVYEAVIRDVEAVNALLNIEKAANKMEKSTDAALKQLGNRMKLTAAQTEEVALRMNALGETTVRAWHRSELSAKEFNTAMGKISTSLATMNRELGQETPQAASTGTVSIWKMATALDHLGVRGAGAALRVVDTLKSLSPAAIAAGVGIAAIVVSVAAVTAALLKMGQMATQAFLEITKQSVQAARQFEVTEAQFIQIFKGKEDLARYALGRIEEMSAEFGVDLTGAFARTFLPQVSSIEEFEHLAQQASTLQASLGKSGDEAAQALQQALAGHFRGLQDNFKITADQIDLIKRYQEELGPLDGLLKGLDEIFAATGRSWDTFGSILDRVIRGITQRIEHLRRTFGAPIADQLNGLLGRLEDFFRDNGELINSLLTESGQIVANFLKFSGEGFEGVVSEADLDALYRLLDALDRLAIELAAFSGDTEAGSFGFILDMITSMVDRTQEWVRHLRETYDLFMNIIEILREAESNPLMALAAASPGTLLAEAASRAVDRSAEVDAQMQQSQIERESKRGTSPASDLEDEADAALAASAAYQEYSRRLAEAKEAQAKWQEVMAEFDADQSARFADILLERDRKHLDLLIENAERYQDMVREDAQKRIDIWSDYYDKLEDIALDGERDLEDAQTKFNRAGEDAERENAREIEDINRKHIDKLKDIRARFDFDAQEAIRNNDAVALLRIRRRMQFELSQTEESTARQRDEAARNAEERRERIRIQLQREIEDASLAQQRKEADAAVGRDRELAAQDVALAREQENLVIWEARKRAELQRSYDQQIQDYNTAWVRRIETLRRQYAIELQIIMEFERDRRRLMQGAGLSNMVTHPGGGLAGGTGGGVVPGPGGIGGRRASPGLVTPGVTYRVNEARSEFFTPTQNGLVAPLERLIMASRRPFVMGGPTDNSRNLHASMSFGGNPADFTPIQLTIIQSMITSSLMGVF